MSVSYIFVFLVLLIVMILAGFGIPYAIGITGVVYMVLKNQGLVDLAFFTIAQKMMYSSYTFVLLAIPFFLLAGQLMNTGSITKKMFKFCNSLVGWIPGGLGHTNILCSVVFAGMSGSAIADAAGLGTIEIKAMEDAGFDTDFSVAVTAASSTIGPIIPPSIPLILYGCAATGASISALLIGGLVPGIMMALAMAVMVYYFAKKRNYPKAKFPTWKGLWVDFKQAFWPLLTPVILIGGMLSGVFTPTEASSVCVLYAFILTAVFYREVKLKDLWNLFINVAKESASTLFIVAASSLFGYLLTRAQIPAMLVEAISSFTMNPLMVLLLLNIVFLIVGCFMDVSSAILVLTPTIMPLVLKVGINPVHMGMVMVLNLMIGLLTPPVGMCLYATARVGKISVERTIKAVLPFYIPLVICLILVTVFPDIVTWLPSLMG